MATVTVARGVAGGIHRVDPAQVAALVALLQTHLPASRSITLDPSEGEGRTLAEIVAFLQRGGVWVSWGGYPFFYTPSTPGGSASNFSRFCRLAGIPDPNPGAFEFVVPPPPPWGPHRALWTPTPHLPAPWVADPAYPPQAVGNAYVWGAIAVPVGQGWWFYASTDYGPTQANQYGPWIIETMAPPAAAAPVWPWIVGGIVVLSGLTAVLLAHRPHR